MKVFPAISGKVRIPRSPSSDNDLDESADFPLSLRRLKLLQPPDF